MNVKRNRMVMGGAVCVLMAGCTIAAASTSHAADDPAGTTSATAAPSIPTSGAPASNGSPSSSASPTTALNGTLPVSLAPAACTPATAGKHTAWLTIRAPKGTGTRIYRTKVAAAEDSPAHFRGPSVRITQGHTARVRESWPADFGWLQIDANAGRFHGKPLFNAIYQEHSGSPKLYTDCSNVTSRAG